MNRLWCVSVVLGTLFLSGCNSIERRSEEPLKQSLPKLNTVAVLPKMIWSGNSGASTKTDAKLQLALTQNRLVTANNKGEIEVKNKGNYKTVWKIKTGSIISSGPTVVDNMIFVGTRDGHVLAYHLQDGQLLWKTSLTGEVLAAPKAKNGMVFVHTLDGSVTALSMKDGHTIWRYNHPIPSIVLRRSSSPVLTETQVIVGFSNGRIVALNRMDGSLAWEKEIAIPKGRSDIQRMNDISADPLVLGNTVYVVNYQGRLSALDLNSGSILWEIPMSSSAGFVVGKQALYIAESNGSVSAVHRKHGQILWKQDSLKGRRLSTPQIYNDQIIIGDEDGYLHWVRESDGHFSARIQVDKTPIEIAPLLQDNHLYVLSKGGRIAIYNLGQVQNFR